MLKFWKRAENRDDDPAASDREVPAPAASAEAAPRRSWIDRLKNGLAKTGSGISGLFIGTKVDEALFEELEAALLMADAGVDATAYLIDQLRLRARKESIEDGRHLKRVLAQLMIDLLRPLERRLDVSRDAAAPDAPAVVMMVGVNGAGKTTSVGKLASSCRPKAGGHAGRRGYVSRRGAQQLVVWGERNGIAVIAQQSGDPAAVVFDAIASASAGGRRADRGYGRTAGDAAAPDGRTEESGRDG